MSTDKDRVLPAIPPGNGGYALDLGGGEGGMRKPLERRGYRYVNVDIRRVGTERGLILGDAHSLPFGRESLELVVSKDTLEHFLRPHDVACEVQRILKPGGILVAWVPFMHPYHGNDLYRYTPLGLRYLLKEVAGLEVLRLESPLWVFSIVGTLVVEALKRIGLRMLEKPIKTACRFADSLCNKRRSAPRSFAHSYLVVAKKHDLHTEPEAYEVPVRA